MRRLALAIALGLGTVGIMAAPAFTSNAHQEETDGCDHGATGKDCKPDPSENGKDCLAHGKHGGISEDHCLKEETSSTTTTVPTDTTVTTVPSPSTPDTATTTVPTTADVPPSLGCVTPDGYPYLTNIEQGGCSEPSVADLNDAVAAPVTELAFGGAASTAMTVLALWLIGGGVIAIAIGKALKRANR